MICILTFLLKIFAGVIFIGIGILLLMLIAYLCVCLFDAIKDEINDSRRY